MGEPVFPVAVDGRSLITHELHQLIQDVLREVIETGGVIRMAENIAEQPDIIKTAGHLFRGMDEIVQGITVFVKVRKDQMTSVQRDRLSSAMEKAFRKSSVRKSESSFSLISLRIPEIDRKSVV